MRVIKKSERIEMPWKNGGGLTYEIDRHPYAGDPYEWRLSQAVVTTDGPFSIFNGFDRWLVLWDGEGLKLNGRTLPPSQPYRFAGEEKIHASLLNGAVTDIGLIFNRAKVQAEMKIVSGDVHLGEGTHYLIAREAWRHAGVEVAKDDIVKIETVSRVSVPDSTLWIVINFRRRPE